MTQYVSSRIATVLLGLAAMLLSPAAARAEQRQFGQYDVYYSVFASDFLQPDVAAALGIVRAADRAVLNVSVRRREPGVAGDAPVAAEVRGTRGDLIHADPLEFREVREDSARYYLAEFAFVDGETLYIDLRIRPDGEARPLELRFDKTLYVD